MLYQAVMLLLCILLPFSTPALAADKVAFGLDWKAEPQYGGYYQPVATGIYVSADWTSASVRAAHK